MRLVKVQVRAALGLAAALAIESGFATAQPIERSSSPFSNLTLNCTETDPHGDEFVRGACNGEFFFIQYRIVPFIDWIRDDSIVAAVRRLIEEDMDLPIDIFRGADLVFTENRNRGDDIPATFGLQEGRGFCQAGYAEHPETDEWLLPSKQWRIEHEGKPLTREKSEYVSLYRCFVSMGYSETLISDFFPIFNAPHSNSDVVIIQSYLAALR